MKYTHLAVAAALAVGALSAQAADPTASLNRTFAEYTGNGPIGNNNLNVSKFYWMFEGTGTWMGQAVNSWFLIWDPVNASVNGSVTFDSQILFLQDDKSELIATSSFNKPGVTYNYNNSLVGLEAGDKSGTSFSGNTLTLAWNAADPGDHVRIMTAVPEPEAYALALAGLGVIGWFGRRRRAD